MPQQEEWHLTMSEAFRPQTFRPGKGSHPLVVLHITKKEDCKPLTKLPERGLPAPGVELATKRGFCL